MTNINGHEVEQSTVFPREREVKRRYLITSISETDRYGDVAHPALEVSVHHDKSGKALVESVTRVKVGDRFVQWTAEFSHNAEHPILPAYKRNPVGRFSQKALDAQAAGFFAQVEANLPSLIDWASRAPMRD